MWRMGGADAGRSPALFPALAVTPRFRAAILQSGAVRALPEGIKCKIL